MRAQVAAVSSAHTNPTNGFLRVRRRPHQCHDYPIESDSLRLEPMTDTMHRLRRLSGAQPRPRTVESTSMWLKPWQQNAGVRCRECATDSTLGHSRTAAEQIGTVRKSRIIIYVYMYTLVGASELFRSIVQAPISDIYESNQQCLKKQFFFFLEVSFLITKRTHQIVCVVLRCHSVPWLPTVAILCLTFSIPACFVSVRVLSFARIGEMDTAGFPGSLGIG